MKRLLLPLVAACLFGGVCRAEVLRFERAITANTNGTFGTATTAPGGLLRRVVVALPAGLTNLTIQAVDVDGTTLVSTNVGSFGSSNAAWSATWTGAEYTGGYSISTKSAMRVSTNGSLSATFHLTTEQ